MKVIRIRERTQAQRDMHEALYSMNLVPEGYRINPDGSVLLKGTENLDLLTRRFVPSNGSLIACTPLRVQDKLFVRLVTPAGYDSKLIPATPEAYAEECEKIGLEAN